MKPTALGVPDYDDFIAKQYGTDQTASDANVVVPGCAHKIPYYNYTHFCIYQPSNAQAVSKGFDANNAPGFEYFQNAITEINSNDTTWDYVDQMYYKFNAAPIGEQFPQLELATSDTTPFGQSVGAAQNYNASRNTALTNPGSNLTISETINPTTRNTLPVVTYKSSTIEKGAHFVRGDNNHKPSRQPTYHIGMRAIEKLSPEANTTRASDFVQANIEFEIEATINIRLPSYPNRFIRPKYYNTGIENAAMGNGSYPDDGADRIVTWSIYKNKGTAPAVNPVDQVNDEQATEGNLTYGSNNRPRRSLRRLGKLEKIKKKK
uniref:VP n=1 Tax=uncultured densovirus TaxID=748192 RepID=A0A7M4BC13_9VIRU|nr:VP [uncultured densovirus]